jgi:hypothetical protein
VRRLHVFVSRRQGFTPLDWWSLARWLEPSIAPCCYCPEGVGDGWTALQLAAANGVAKVVERLLAHGADASATVDGKTALEHAEAATSPWRSLPTIKLLRAASGRRRK